MQIKIFQRPFRLWHRPLFSTGSPKLSFSDVSRVFFGYYTFFRQIKLNCFFSLKSGKTKFWKSWPDLLTVTLTCQRANLKSDRFFNDGVSGNLFQWCFKRGLANWSSWKDVGLFLHQFRLRRESGFFNPVISWLQLFLCEALILHLIHLTNASLVQGAFYIFFFQMKVFLWCP